MSVALACEKGVSYMDMVLGCLYFACAKRDGDEKKLPLLAEMVEAKPEIAPQAVDNAPTRPEPVAAKVEAPKLDTGSIDTQGLDEKHVVDGPPDRSKMMDVFRHRGMTVASPARTKSAQG